MRSISPWSDPYKCQCRPVSPMCHQCQCHTQLSERRRRFALLVVVFIRSRFSRAAISSVSFRHLPPAVRPPFTNIFERCIRCPPPHDTAQCNRSHIDRADRAPLSRRCLNLRFLHRIALLRRHAYAQTVTLLLSEWVGVYGCN